MKKHGSKKFTSGNNHVLFSSLLRTVANEIKLLRHLWLEALDAKRDSVFGSEIPLIQLLMRGIFPSLAECEKIVPRINVFCSLFSWYLFTVHDEEFFGRTGENCLTYRNNY